MSRAGDDLNDGSISSPVATIEKARDIIREKRLNGKIKNEPVNIILREGIYEIEKTIDFTIADSGDFIYPLTIKAYENEEVRLTGGKDISVSLLSDADSNIKSRINEESVRENIKAVNLYELGITDLGEISRRGHQISENKLTQAEVSVDGERLKLAGWPNEGFVGLDKVVEYGTRKNPASGDNGINVTNGCSFTYKGYDRPLSWQEPEKAWISGVLGANFAYDYYPLEKIEGNKITLREGAITDYYSKQFFRFENILEELDMPGEYYIDRDNGMLYIYMPKESDENSVITVSSLKEDIIKISNAKNIKFENVEISDGRKSGIVASGECSNIIVNNCKVHSLADDGVLLSGCTFSSVRNCEIYDIGKNAITVKGGNFAKAISSGNIIYNNDIYRFAQIERCYNSGVYIGYQSVGVKVLNNHIHDGPHAGIIFYGINNEISYNEIDDVVNEFHDMDAVYVNNYDMPWERGNKIYYNYFHDIGGETFNGEHQMNVACIRTDNNGHGLTIKKNIFYNIGKGATNNVSGIHAQGTHNKIEENLFVDCKESYCGYTSYNPNAKYDMTSSENIAIKNKLDGYANGLFGKLFPEIKNFWNEHPANAKTNTFKNNLMVNINVPMSTTVYGGVSKINDEGFRGAKETIASENNYIFKENIGFKDYENKNFELSDGVEIPFENIYMHLIGLR